MAAWAPARNRLNDVPDERLVLEMAVPVSLLFQVRSLVMAIAQTCEGDGVSENMLRHWCESARKIRETMPRLKVVLR